MNAYISIAILLFTLIQSCNGQSDGSSSPSLRITESPKKTSKPLVTRITPETKEPSKPTKPKKSKAPISKKTKAPSIDEPDETEEPVQVEVPTKSNTKAPSTVSSKKSSQKSSTPITTKPLENTKQVEITKEAKESTGTKDSTGTSESKETLDSNKNDGNNSGRKKIDGSQIPEAVEDKVQRKNSNNESNEDSGLGSWLLPSCIAVGVVLMISLIFAVRKGNKAHTEEEGDATTVKNETYLRKKSEAVAMVPQTDFSKPISLGDGHSTNNQRISSQQANDDIAARIRNLRERTDDSIAKDSTIDIPDCGEIRLNESENEITL